MLVATDIAARGIDIHKLPHVVNYELPNSAEDYVHRIGRTARAGQTGGAISLVCVDELKLLSDIEKLIGTKIEQVKLPGYDVDPTIKPEPIQNGRAGRGNGRQGVDRQPEGKRSGTQGRGAKSPGQKQGRSRNGRGRAA